MRTGLLSLLAALAIVTISTPVSAFAASRAATVVLVWSVADPPSTFADVRKLDVALRAPFEIGGVLRALNDNPGARFAIEAAPGYLTALHAASTNPLEAATQATGSLGDERSHDVIALLAQLPPMDAAAAASPGGKALALLSTRARDEIGGASSNRLQHSDLQRAIALQAAARLAPTGSAAARALLAAPPAQADELVADANALLASSVQAIAARFASAARAGAIEIVATPDGDPVLPLLIDSGGKSASDPTAIPLDASADAAAMISDALGTAASLNGDGHAGLASPYGAYDDAAAEAIETGGARYAIFSDRIVRASQAGGSVEALAAALAAPYQMYDLQTSRTVHMPVFFWDEASSSALETIAPTAPAGAFAARLVSLAQTAAAASPNSHAMVAVRVRMDRQWSQRDDAISVIGDVARALNESGASATPSGYAAMHPKAPPAYGFPPGSSLGSLDAFDGSSNQQAMWSALAAARFAASGGGPVTNTAAKSLLLRAEAGMWYRVPDLPLSPDAIRAQLDQFRALLADVYKACGKSAPVTIAPQRTPPPSSPPATPAPKPSPSYPQAL